MKPKITVVLEYENEADIPRFGAGMVAVVYDTTEARSGWKGMAGKIIAVAFEDVLQEKE